jgi:thiamine biosynthesis lipoprotein ApbE
MITQKFPLFGSEVEFRIYDVESDDFVALDAISDIYREALRLQRIFNLYDPNSELNELNIRRKIDASEELLFVLKKAIHFSRITNGLYDVTLGRNFL